MRFNRALLLFSSLVTYAIVTSAAFGDIGFNKEELELARGACLAGSNFDFITEADGSISLKNLEGKGKLHVGRKDITIVDVPDNDKRSELSEIRQCIMKYLKIGDSSQRPKQVKTSLKCIVYQNSTHFKDNLWAGQSSETFTETLEIDEITNTWHIYGSPRQREQIAAINDTEYVLLNWSNNGHYTNWSINRNTLSYMYSAKVTDIGKYKYSDVAKDYLLEVNATGRCEII